MSFELAYNWVSTSKPTNGNVQESCLQLSCLLNFTIWSYWPIKRTWFAWIEGKKLEQHKLTWSRLLPNQDFKLHTYCRGSHSRGSCPLATGSSPSSGSRSAWHCASEVAAMRQNEKVFLLHWIPTKVFLNWEAGFQDFELIFSVL